MENSIPIAMVRDVYHQRELNSQGENGALPAIFLLSTGTVLTKSIYQNSELITLTGSEDPFKFQ